MRFEEVTPNTLSVTHIFDGEEVVSGGDDGQVWIATFSTPAYAKAFVEYLQSNPYAPVTGIRP